MAGASSTPAIKAGDHQSRAHSSIIGGSTAAQRINCPGSYRLEQGIPDAVKNKSSTYADEGTALHEAMQFALENDITDPEELLGRTFHVNGFDWEITRERVDEALAPCFDFLEALDEELEDEGGYEFLVEQRCAFPGVEGAFGTNDFMARTDKRTIIVDWKFGSGKPVYARYRDEENNEHVNEQPMFYGASALYTVPSMFGADKPEDVPDDWPVDLYIMQPRSGDGLPTLAKITVGDLRAFIPKVQDAVERALNDPAAPTRSGPWCEFKACKLRCPQFVTPLLDLSKLNTKKLTPVPTEQPVEKLKDIDWSIAYRDLLNLADYAENVVGEIRRQAHAFMEAGHKVVDKKLVPKRATESYTDETGAVKFAEKAGVHTDDIFKAPEVKSPAQLGKALEPFMKVDDEGKPLTTKKEREAFARKKLEQFTAKVSSGTNIADADDKRPDVTPTPALLAELARKLLAS